MSLNTSTRPTILNCDAANCPPATAIIRTTPSTRGSCIAAVTLLLAVTLGHALASPPPDQKPATAHIQAADKAFHTGYAAVQRNDLPAAEHAFAEAVRLAPNIAAGHSAYGSVLLSLGKTNAAIRQLEQAHTLDPQEASATLNLLHAYQQANRPQQAIALARQATTSPAAYPPDAWFTFTQLLLANSLLADAQQAATKASAAYPDNAVVADSAGVVSARNNNLAAAREHFRRAIALDANLAPAHLHLGTLLLLNKDVPSAITELTTTTRLAPNDAEAFLQLGKALGADGQDDAAISALQHALAIAPSVDAQYALALALQNTGRTAEALPLFKEVAIARPEDSAALTNLGLALVQLGNAKEAISLYNRALALSPNDWILQQDLGVAYLQQSDLNHAIEHFKAGLLIDPTNAQLHYDLGLAYKLKDDLPNAIATFLQSEQEDATLADPPYTLGVLYMQTGRFPEAQSQLQTAVTLRPGNGDAWSVIGSVEKSLNHADKAIAALTTAIHLQPDQPGNHITLAAVYAQQGRRDEASAERRLAADLSRTAINRQKSSFALDTGQQLMKQGHPDRAIDQFRTAIAAQPDSSAAHQALADALAASGHAADAAVERQKAATSPAETPAQSPGP